MFFNVNRFHVFVLLTWQFSLFFNAQQLFPIFSNYIPQWRCDPKEAFGKNCTVYLNCKHTVEFESNYFKSAAQEFDWVCGDHSYLRALFSQVQFFGVLVGTVLSGAVSDIVGRKPVSVASLAVGISFVFLSGLSPSWQTLLVTRAIVGLSIGGTLAVNFTYVVEMLLPEQRMALRAFFNWGTVRLLLTLLCWAFSDWRTASYACAIASLPALFIVIFIFPESPTWLHNKGRIEKMKESERYIAKIAGTKVVETEVTPVTHKKTINDLFHDIQLFKRVAVLWVIFFTAAICSYAIDLNSSNISGHLFWNQIIFSVLIALSKMLLISYDSFFPKFSRRNLHQGAQLVVCVCFLILIVVVILAPKSVWVLIINVTGIMFIEYTWDACYLCAVESTPTNLRGTALGTCSLMARVGALLAPSLAFFSKFWAPSPYVTVVVLGSINLIVSYLWLVETKGVVLDKVHLDEDPSKTATLKNSEERETMLQKSNENNTNL